MVLVIKPDHGIRTYRSFHRIKVTHFKRVSHLVSGESEGPLTENIRVQHGQQQPQHHGELPGTEEAVIRFLSVVARGAPERLLLLGRRLVLVNQLPDAELLHHLLGVGAVADVVEVLAGVLADDVEQHLVAAGVVVEEPGHVVDQVVDDEHRVLLGVPLGDLLARESFLFRHRVACGRPASFVLGEQLRPPVAPPLLDTRRHYRVIYVSMCTSKIICHRDSAQSACVAENNKFVDFLNILKKIKYIY